MKCDKHYWDSDDNLFSLPKRMSKEKVAKYMNYWKSLDEDTLRRKRMFDAFEICDYILDNRKRKSIPITAKLNNLIAKYEKTSEDVIMVADQKYVVMDGEEPSDHDLEDMIREETQWVEKNID